MNQIRIDKWLWCVRVFKSRSLAAEACDGGKVKIAGERVKPSYHVKTGDVITVQQRYIKRTYQVIALLDKRVSAARVKNFACDITPPEELDKLKTERFVSYQSKFKGIGRPTKKDRRLINKIRGY
ncbi:MAG: RNA-binding S4 domain-containing protein [Chlorobi bacterium]|nr:RNA-binding S4 domain-containing protein [Chlorobiota bacterium]MCI0716292.1 RNA-binding S4 domain-containing protein [Chlorobiota bacterium]